MSDLKKVRLFIEWISWTWSNKLDKKLRESEDLDYTTL